MIASPGLRNPELGLVLGLGLGQVHPELRNPGEAIMWVFPSIVNPGLSICQPWVVTTQGCLNPNPNPNPNRNPNPNPNLNPSPNAKICQPWVVTTQG